MTPRYVTILLIDDDHDDWEIFDLAVKKIDPSIKVFHSGYCEDALESLSKRKIIPDYIFLDLNMPKMTGHECLVHLKQMEHVYHIPICIYSTSRRLPEIDNLLKNGAHHYINKSNTVNEIVFQLKEIIVN